MIENPSSSVPRLFISVDVNGMNKKPNVFGRDLFTFEITPEGKLLPMGAEGTTYTDTDKYCSKNSNDRLNGIACTAKALSDPDYFKKCINYSYLSASIGFKRDACKRGNSRIKLLLPLKIRVRGLWKIKILKRSLLLIFERLAHR